MKTIENIDDLISHLKYINYGNKCEYPRAEILGLIMDKKEKWCLAIKSLLIKSNTNYISVNYLLEKLKFCKRNPNKPYMFLDAEGIVIYNILSHRPTNNNLFINHIDSYKELIPK